MATDPLRVFLDPIDQIMCKTTPLFTPLRWIIQDYLGLMFLGDQKPGIRYLYVGENVLIFLNQERDLWFYVERTASLKEWPNWAFASFHDLWHSPLLLGSELKQKMILFQQTSYSSIRPNEPLKGTRGETKSYHL